MITKPSAAGGVHGERIRVRGLVQGVGFRPAVWRIARDCGLAGEVLNDGSGVLITAWGERATLDRFVNRLRLEAPPLARIETIERAELDHARASTDFRIGASVNNAVHTGVLPDAATCPACLADTLDSGNRRYRYPFSNCTHCGPRFSIIDGVPYDRAATSMADFAMCSDCRREYDDPADRRFHAQPNACAKCGPSVWLEDEYGKRVFQRDDAIEATRRLITAGAIVAIKGLGGFHLACDAGNELAVTRLRAGKRRYQKAFALMARDLNMIRRYCAVNSQEQQLLESSAAPVVVLAARDPHRTAASVAPGMNTLGFMLPYTPLHHLLMRDLPRPIVLTSGNCCEEPQCTDNEVARDQLSDIADYWLLHDREIRNRVDDSVARVIDGQPRIMRRARGYAPTSLVLPAGFEPSIPILALGGELKNTFCIIKDDKAVISQHIGDLEHAVGYRDYRRNLDLYRDLFSHRPELLAVDMHPDYLAGKLGRDWAHGDGIPLIEVQHHHAHIASCMAEHRLPLDTKPILGIVLDGLGYGNDGGLWGGELLRADYRGFDRLAHFEPVPMIGAAQAIREPWRNTYAHISNAIGWETFIADYGDLEIAAYLRDKPRRLLDVMLVKRLNCPPSSSCGRLFDAVAGALGLCRDQASYEGQAAVELEALARDERQQTDSLEKPCSVREYDVYPFDLENGDAPLRLRWGPLWLGILNDLKQGINRALIARRFHSSLAKALCDTAVQLCERENIDTVILSGGVFQNKMLLEDLSDRLRTRSLWVFSPQQLPCNDGGLSLGQAVIAAAHAN
jgi:hydrogenase maturation protein HypF